MSVVEIAICIDGTIYPEEAMRVALSCTKYVNRGDMTKDITLGKRVIVSDILNAWRKRGMVHRLSGGKGSKWKIINGREYEERTPYICIILNSLLQHGPGDRDELFKHFEKDFPGFERHGYASALCLLKKLGKIIQTSSVLRLDK